MWFDPTGTTLNAVAGTVTWEGNVWTTSATPVASPGPFADTAFTVFSVTGEAATSATVTVNTSHNFAGLFNGGLTGDTACAALTISGPGSLNIISGVQGINIASGNTTISCTIGGVGGIQPEGSGQLFLNGINTFSGGLNIATGGVLVNFNNSASFGTGALTLTANGGALISEGTAAITITNAWVVTASVTENLVGNVAGVTWSGPWTLGANTPLIGSGGNVANLNTLSGVISGTGGIGRSAAQAPAGILKISGPNTYSGKTSIQSGITSVASINSVTTPAQQATSNLGKPSSAANGTISIGGTTVGGALVYTGIGETTDRVLDLAGTTGGAIVENDGSGPIIFTSTGTASGVGVKTLTLQGSNTGTNSIAKIVNSTSATALTKAQGGTWVLIGANSYTGATTVSGGTLALGAGGSIAGSAVTVASTATLGNVTTSTHTIGGATTLSSGGLASFTATGGGSSVVGKISVTGNLTLNANVITVNVSGSSLSAGTYRLMDCTGTLAGSANATPTITGTALTPGLTATVSTTTGTAGHFDLVIAKSTPAFSSLTASQSVNYGTSSVTLGGTLSASGPVYPAAGETITVTINGNAQTTTISDSTGDFSFGYNSSSSPAGADIITYSYAGNAALNSKSDTSTTLTVNQAALSITANNQSKTYGQTLGSGNTNFTSVGLLNGETIGSVTVTGLGTAASATVAGSPYTITPGAATGGTFNANNYSITYNSGSLTVNPATLTVTANSYAMAYGAANPAFAVTYTNFTNSETLGTSDVTGAPALTSVNTNTDIGAYTITNGIGTLLSSNYTFNLVNGTLTITNALSTNVVTVSTNPALPATPVVFTATVSTLAPSLAIPTNSVQFLIDGVTNGSPIFLTGGVAQITNSSLSHGSHVIEVDYAGDTNALGGTNIIGSTNTVSELINTPPVAGAASFARTAGQGLTINVGALLGNASDADADAVTLVSVSATSANGGTIGNTNAIGATNGVISYTPPGGTNANAMDTFTYTVQDSFGATASGTVTVTVSPATSAFASLTASQSAIYGAPAITLGGSLSAAGPLYPAAGETITVTINGNAQTTTVNDSTGDFSLTYNPSTIPASGTAYPISYSYAGDSILTGASDATTTLTVNQAALSVTAGAQSKTYGQTVVFGAGGTNFTSVGLKNSETIGSVTLAVSGGGGAASAPVSGSPYTIAPSAATGGTFNPNNYAVTYNPASLTVGPATLTVTADNYSRAFGANNPVFTVTYTNFVNGEVLGTSDVTGAPALASVSTNADIGTYAISNSVGTLASTNYTLNLVNGTLIVTNALSANAVTVSSNPSLPATPVVFTATVSTLAPSLAVPTNSVQFLIDGITSGSPIFLNGGVAQITNSSLSHGSHVIEVDYAGDTNVLGGTNIVGSTNTVSVLINTPPVAGAASYGRQSDLPLTISVSGLLTNASDVDGDLVSLVSVSAISTNGATIGNTNAVGATSGFITYTPPGTNPNVTDTFTYTVEDTFGAISTGTVTVTILPNSFAVNITGVATLPNGTSEISFTGIPNRVYLIQATTNLAPTVVWTTISTNTAGTNGVFQFNDLDSTNHPLRFYRTTTP